MSPDNVQDAFGTLAMFRVGGGILTHGFTPVYDAIHHFAEGFSGVVGALVPTIANGLFGVLAGALLVAMITPLARWWQAARDRRRTAG